jgi:carbamoylphosphate synthase small subunit
MKFTEAKLIGPTRQEEYHAPQAVPRGHPDFVMTHVHLNDETVAGMRIKSKKCFSVQYHPEAAAGPHDASYLFDRFIDLMSKKVHA